MTTATLQLQRHRFVHHATAALLSRLPGTLRSLVSGKSQESRLSKSEAAARDAQRVRELAYAYSQTDPSFAADLYAAAARHEGTNAD
jgi:hypothetical protein